MNTDESYEYNAEAQRLKAVEKRKTEEHEAISRMQGFLVRANNWRTCLNCENFKDVRKVVLTKVINYKHCGLYNAVPPPDVIVYGCKEWNNDDIPF